MVHMSKVRGGGMTGGLLRPSKLGAFNNQGDDNTEEQVLPGIKAIRGQEAPSALTNLTNSPIRKPKPNVEVNNIVRFNHDIKVTGCVSV